MSTLLLEQTTSVDVADDRVVEQSCRSVVQAMIARYGWALLPEDELVALTLTAVQTAGWPDNLEQLVTQLYTLSLYEACHQPYDVERRERGYGDLFRYLYRAAYNRRPDLAEDATQRALLLIYEQIDHCRKPTAFLFFAYQKLRHALKQERCARGDELPADEHTGNHAEEDQEAAPPMLLQQEQLHVLLDAIKRLPDQRMQRAILLRYFAGLSDQEISTRLNLTVGHARVLRHRGLRLLRSNRRLSDYITETIGQED